ncbi:Filament-like plant protein 5 [Raphanus sativus]|uniref:Filament-like plant protein 5 n=1 Tax=Raphanus sativus TaxID=3726 RepID=A0A6J0MIT2_RAPSA|nr:filament-like plant protein 5 [Raphanus sativus]KAJ4913867.1 Filament-like plant protein 5 [Raphanus sativus]
MDGRSWPWKKKSSDKATTEKPVVGNESTNVSSLSYLASLESQEKCKNTNYVQITMDSYTHLSRMEDQVKLFEGQVKDLSEKLTTAQSELNTKECLILQHAKVAEEAVSGWEKADAETLILKRQLESVTLLKLTAEDRASHLDDALKECTRQIRTVKDESEQKLQAVVLAKTIHWDKIKAELEGKIDELNQGLHRAASDNASLTRSLQERSEMVVRIREERSKAEAEVERLKTSVQLAEKEISSLKYDVHVASKEVEIRNEEKNMSLKSAENANRQYLEGVKKIAKLEGECQRLRGLLRKKLPGPGAMAQMKQEVESLGHELAADPKWEECRRRAVEMEEEIQTLKEQLASRSNELSVSRNVCAKTLGKLKALEGQMQSGNQYQPSVTSVSEDGFDEEGSSSECGGGDSHKARKAANIDGGSSKPRVLSNNRLELMDDFLEIEKLAASDPNSASKSCNSACSRYSEQDDDTALDQLLRSRISRVFESQEGVISVEKIVEATRVLIQEMQGSSTKQLSSCPLFEVADETMEKHVLSSQDSNNKATLLDKEVEDSESYPSGDTFAKDDSTSKSLLKELKLEKENIELELSRCLQNLESTKLELEEKEQVIAEMNSQRDLQSLAETQLKCVTESYKTLELHTKDLEAKVKRLEEETERLETAFSTEKREHEETLAKCKDLQENMQRNETCRECSASKVQPNQEKDIASATEKLAACQETIHLLSQQLQSLQPQSNHVPKSQSPEKKLQHYKTSEAEDDVPHDDHNIQPSHSFRHTVNPTVHAIIKSSSVSSSSREDGEKHTRGLGRFFSSKSKNSGR